MTAIEVLKMLRKLVVILLVWNIMLTCSIIGVAVGNGEQKQKQVQPVNIELPPLEIIEELNV